MPIKMEMELDVSHGTNKAEVQEFLDRIPEGAKFSSRVTHQLADRPYESDDFTLKLVANW